MPLASHFSPCRLTVPGSVLQVLLALAMAPAGATAGTLRIEPWSLPAPPASAQPALVAGHEGLYLSWVEPSESGHRLRLAHYRDGAFSPTVTIAEGRRWFVNWADFPAVQPLPDGRLAAYFLEKTAALPYAYAIRMSWRATPEGGWSAPVTLHDDGTDSEHGFVAMWPWDGDLGIAWLDGRHTAGSANAGHHGHSGAMSLRAARLSADGERREWELDRRTCDCCQTSAAMATAGPVVVYRGRSDGEVRDILIRRWRDGRWQAPAQVHADGWVMPGCPVNGPAVVADGDLVDVAWYTAAGGVPEVRFARSRDGGATFSAPVTVDRGEHVQGRVHLLRAGEGLWLSWLREEGDRASLWLARLDPARAAVEPVPQQVAQLPRGRGTGFPRMALLGDDVHLVWTEPLEGRPHLRGVRVRRAAATNR